MDFFLFLDFVNSYGERDAHKLKGELGREPIVMFLGFFVLWIFLFFLFF